MKRRGRWLTEEAVGQEDAGDDGQRQAHQAPRALEDQHDDQRADREIESRVKAGPLDERHVDAPSCRCR
jgi:hypothetical protein